MWDETSRMADKIIGQIWRLKRHAIRNGVMQNLGASQIVSMEKGQEYGG